MGGVKLFCLYCITNQSRMGKGVTSLRNSVYARC